ncbi:MAG: TolC family protein [Planctomycetota bacterium]|nr:TolC family protein [Planctomycetota bacterium]
MLLLQCAGCVAPGQIDENLVTRYQRSVLARSPQKRLGKEGLDLLRPAAAEAGTFKTVKDKLTDRDGVQLSLDEAVRLAISNSLDIRVVSFAPAISREQMIQAAAAFDWVVFAGASHTRTDHHVETAFPHYRARSIPVEVGVRKSTVTGGTAELSWSLTRTSDNLVTTVLNPNYESLLSLQLTQPLLRGAWPDYNLAALKIAQLSEKASASQFRQTVEQVVAETQAAYWALVQARRELQIQDVLLEKTIQTRDRVEARLRMDATKVELKQAEAAVETRRATLYRARQAIFDIQDRLARLLATERMNPLRRCAIVPTTSPVTSKVNIDPTDQLINALRHSPAMEQARLAIAAADVQVGVAKNETLPVLDLAASVGAQGMNRVGGKAGGESLTFDYLDHSVGLLFEYPIGNRAAGAMLRQRKFEHLRSVTEMQNTADAVAVNVRNALRQIETAFQEMKARKAAVAASQAQLTALEDTERIRGRLTPEFLQLKLSSQEVLAAAERAEIQTIVDFNTALARLAQITGTTLQQKNIKLAVENSSR